MNDALWIRIQDLALRPFTIWGSPGVSNSLNEWGRKGNTGYREGYWSISLIIIFGSNAGECYFNAGCYFKRHLASSYRFSFWHQNGWSWRWYSGSGRVLQKYVGPWHLKKDAACKIGNSENNLQHTYWILKDCNILLGQVCPLFLSLIILSFTRSTVPK